MAWHQILFGLILITGSIFVCWLAYELRQERARLRHTAYQEGIGEEYDLELRRLLELERLKPKDAPSGPDPYTEALLIVRLRKRTMAKNPPPGDNTIFNISHNTIAGLNFGTVLGDLNASVQILQTHGGQQIADAIGKLTNAIGNSTEIKDTDRKELLENVAQVSKEASSHPDQRRPGVIKACLALLTTSLSTAKELIPPDARPVRKTQGRRHYQLVVPSPQLQGLLGQGTPGNREPRRLWQPLFYNLLIPLSPMRFESHPLRQVYYLQPEFGQ